MAPLCVSPTEAAGAGFFMPRIGDSMYVQDSAQMLVAMAMLARVIGQPGMKNLSITRYTST